VTGLDFLQNYKDSWLGQASQAVVDSGIGKASKGIVSTFGFKNPQDFEANTAEGEVVTPGFGRTKKVNPYKR